MERYGPLVAMLVADLAFAVMNILVKKCLDQGMDCLVLITVRQMVASIFMAPIAHFKERKSRPKLTWWISLQFFLSALFGAFLTQYFFFLGLRYTNATFACAFLNMTPILTFLMALPLRQEKVSPRTTAGKAKLVATMTCVGGVLILMFYRGPQLGHVTGHIPTLTHQTPTSDPKKAAVRWTIGSVALFLGSICWSAWFILQAKIGKQYPAIYSGTTIMFFFAALQAAALALATMHRGGKGLWVHSLTGRLQIVTVLFAGVVGSGLSYLVMSWCIVKRGPLFTAAFSPLTQVFVAIIDFALTHRPPFLGSVLGSLLVVIGLYLLLWGKSKEAGSCEVQPVQEGGLRDVSMLDKA